MRYKTIICFVLIFILLHVSGGFAQQTTKQDTVLELMHRIEILTEEIEKAKLGDGIRSGLQESRIEKRLRALEHQVATLELEQTSPTALSGYMDFHYNKSSPGDAILDFHRFVLLFSHEFSEAIRFYSELEIEHAFIKSGQGEVELEQAFVDFHVDPRLAIRAGIVLVPMGIQNERHEGPAYFGVERHQVETVLIPTTWFDPGVGIFGRIVPGLDYKLYLLGSLDGTKFKASGIRGARSKGFKTNIDNPAIAGRLTYSGFKDLTVGTSLYYGGGVGHKIDIDASITIYDIDFAYRYRSLELRGIWTQTFVGNADDLTAAIDAEDGPIARRMEGFGLEVAVHLLPQTHEWDLALFARYEEADTQAKIPTGFLPVTRFDRSWITLGASFLPHPDVVIKVDYQIGHNEDPTVEEGNSFNIGLGWWF